MVTREQALADHADGRPGPLDIPRPCDPRIRSSDVPAVARAPVDDGVARRKIDIVANGPPLGQTAVTPSNM